MSIRREEDLLYHFRELISEDPDLQWANFQERSSNRFLDGQVCLQLDGRTLDFSVEFKLKPGIPALEEILSRGPNSKTLLVAPNLTQRVLQFCKEHHLSCIDLNGRAWLRADGLMVDRKTLPGRSFNYELEPRNIFEGKSGRLVRSLLTDRDKVWTQAELVKRTRVSSGMVSRLVNYFVAQAYLDKLSPREYRLNDFDGLLDEWCAADNLQKRCTTSYYAGPIGGPEQVADKLQQWAKNESVPLAFTQWLGAYQRCPYTEPAICSAYVKRLPETASLESLGLRSVKEGGKVWLHVPKDEGVFLETESRNNHPFTLVSDAQIYVDLKKTGLRGPDAAQAFRDWKGFCRK
ncbi:MAG: hypothetical protein ABF379_16940 [Akkermansiaceae bacterium]